jgi:predicted nucleic acid-binding protein
MKLLDASSIIHAWDNYPAEQFPGLWNWMASQIAEKHIIISRVAFEEVTHKAPECAEWLKSAAIEMIAVNNAIILEALRIKSLLDISGDAYHVKGVDENDIFIIATASVLGISLISDEGRQKLPDIPKKRKIPAVCAMAEVAVPCINFLEFIRQSKVVFS